MNYNQDGHQNVRHCQLSVCTCGHSLTLTFITWFLPNFILWFYTFIKLFPKIDCGFFPMIELITKMTCQNGRRLWTLCNLVIYHPISSKFHIWVIFIKLFPKIVCEICVINDNQDGCQNDNSLSWCTCGHKYMLHGWQFSSLYRNSVFLTSPDIVFVKRVNPLRYWWGGGGGGGGGELDHSPLTMEGGG